MNRPAKEILNREGAKIAKQYAKKNAPAVFFATVFASSRLVLPGDSLR